jgi:hypothetical protein
VVDVKKCFACGFDYPHEGDCPAKDKKCRTCNLVGHFARAKFCKTPTNKKNNGIKAISSHEKVKEKLVQEEKAAQKELVRLTEKRFLFVNLVVHERDLQ